MRSLLLDSGPLPHRFTCRPLLEVVITVYIEFRLPMLRMSLRGFMEEGGGGSGEHSRVRARCFDADHIIVVVRCRSNCLCRGFIGGVGVLFAATDGASAATWCSCLSVASFSSLWSSSLV